MGHFDQLIFLFCWAESKGDEPVYQSMGHDRISIGCSWGYLLNQCGNQISIS
jgi:hypothetical protein